MARPPQIAFSHMATLRLGVVPSSAVNDIGEHGMRAGHSIGQMSHLQSAMMHNTIKLA